LIFNFHHQVRKTVAFSSCQKSTEWNPRIFFKRPINLALDLDRIIFWSSHLGPRTICPHVLKSTLFTTSLCPSCATQRVTKKKCYLKLSPRFFRGDLLLYVCLDCSIYTILY
jgi:hypothetical protein